MRRSTTFAGTDTSAATEKSAARRKVGAVLGAELVCAVLLVSNPRTGPSGPLEAAPVSYTQSVSPAPLTVVTPDGRTARLVDLGAPGGAALLERIAGELPGATEAVTAFWGPQWRRDVSVVVAGSAEQFAILAGGSADVAATATAERIMFSPAAGTMNATDLRTVLRHELFHYAARPDTAADAPVWLTEGVADYVGRPPAAVPPTAAPAPPSDAELATPGPGRSAAYDRAWGFATYVADTYGAGKLRALYAAACGPGHTDVATAVRNVLGTDLNTLLEGAR
ncbi:peptidase [Mycobacterium sp. ITM-2016-00317]|uniref:peptidase n=1 Tax=Mycobacterium sp. ITM-2016-00317 TaxID=2099694 RepID=UPI00287F68E2|nr:peptidase [Mycobacterium sp. ITM-2016-00317]WNG85640.1 peptidase [Mycobacterium sp. ITM-2016-00317]